MMKRLVIISACLRIVAPEDSMQTCSSNTKNQYENIHIKDNVKASVFDLVAYDLLKNDNLPVSSAVVLLDKQEPALPCKGDKSSDKNITMKYSIDKNNNTTSTASLVDKTVVDKNAQLLLKQILSLNSEHSDAKVILNEPTPDRNINNNRLFMQDNSTSELGYYAAGLDNSIPSLDTASYSSTAAIDVGNKLAETAAETKISTDALNDISSIGASVDSAKLLNVSISEKRSRTAVSQTLVNERQVLRSRLSASAQLGSSSSSSRYAVAGLQFLYSMYKIYDASSSYINMTLQISDVITKYTGLMQRAYPLLSKYVTVGEKAYTGATVLGTALDTATYALCFGFANPLVYPAVKLATRCFASKVVDKSMAKAADTLVSRFTNHVRSSFISRFSRPSLYDRAF